MANTPEIRQWPVVPILAAETYLVEGCDAHPVLVGFAVLGLHVHRYLCKIHIGPYPGRSGNPGVSQHIPYHLHGEIVRAQPIYAQILGRIYKDLIYRIHMYVFGRNIL